MDILLPKLRIFFATKKENLRIVCRNHKWYLPTLVLNALCLLLIFFYNVYPDRQTSLISNLSASYPVLHPLSQGKNTKEVFGFAPFWTFDKLDNVDFNVLTTFSYFGIPVSSDGNLDQSDQGYITFMSPKATQIFAKAHSFGTRVVLTLTQMDNWTIEIFLDNPQAQNTAISQAVDLVNKRGIDGINVDFEYQGDPGQIYRDKFTAFVENLTSAMHSTIPNSYVTVSVYAGSAKDPKIYDLSPLSKASDKIFMMAYDFGNSSSDNAMPTAPLYGYKEGKYWYDVSTAVNDFLTKIPAQKLILGVPWYGYNYSVYAPSENSPTGWGSVAQTYTVATDNVNPSMPGITDFKIGWDQAAKVGWKAYFVAAANTWRMIFLDDSKSLSIKYDYAKQKNLAGVGIWALGFDEGKTDLWKSLKDQFGQKAPDATIARKEIRDASQN